MAWNGSDNGKATSANSPSSRGTRPACPHSRGLVKGLVALALIAALGGGVIYFLMSGDAPVVAKEKTTKPGAITEVAPAPAATNAVDASIIQPSGKKHEPRQLTVDRTSAVATPNIASNSLVITYGMVNGKSIFKRKIFRHNSENLIAAVLTTQPGLRIIDIPLGKRFEEDFANSLADPIRIEDGDTPEEIELKQQMVDVKKELVERIKAGENLSDIITEARKDLNKLAQYNEDVRHAYFEMRQNAQDMDEVEEFRLSANKMLVERGLPPIRADKRGKFKVEHPMDEEPAAEAKGSAN